MSAGLKPVDARAGRLCSNCNAPKDSAVRAHCASPTCSWWRCGRCGAQNDRQGRNDKTSLDGRSKTGGAS